jgi:hypothetical protein
MDKILSEMGITTLYCTTFVMTLSSNVVISEQFLGTTETEVHN